MLTKIELQLQLPVILCVVKENPFKVIALITCHPMLLPSIMLRPLAEKPHFSFGDRFIGKCQAYQ